MKLTLAQICLGWKFHDVSSRPAVTTVLRPRLLLGRRSPWSPGFMHGRFGPSDVLGKISRISSTLPGHRFQGGRHTASLPALVILLSICLIWDTVVHFSFKAFVEFYIKVLIICQSLVNNFLSVCCALLLCYQAKMITGPVWRRNIFGSPSWSTRCPFSVSTRNSRRSTSRRRKHSNSCIALR
jgi:hypothetical protein